MSLISNRKRPRGFSGSLESKGSLFQTGLDTGANTQAYSSSSSDDQNYSNLNLNINLNTSDSTVGTGDSKFFKHPSKNDYFLDHTVFEESDDITDEVDDDLIILEERNLNTYRIKPKRNNSDSILFLDNDSFHAFNLFNVNNNDDNDPNNEFSTANANGPKKQRTNSLPQLPQVRCFYQKLPANYMLASQKLGNVKTSVIPFSANSPPCDDKDGHFIIELNSVFANRFITLKLLGQGTFGKVVECYDKINRENVAIKIIRNIPKYRDAAKIELRILATLKKFDNKNLNHCIHLRECFDFRGHICIVTDLLKISLYDFMENNKFVPFTGSHIQAIAKQLIRSVTFLHDLNLIHTDLKPENILLYDDSYVKKPLFSKTLINSYLALTNNEFKKVPKFSKVLRNPSIQIIDFGSAIFNDEYHSSIVSTRHYRAPEIVLGVGWSFPCDMWSIGCILVELLIGEPLFKTHDNLEHLAMIEKFVGQKIDKSMVKVSKKNENECGLKYFTNEYNSQDDGDEDDIDDDCSDASSDIIINDELTRENSLSLIFPSNSTPQSFITNVNQLSRIDLFISKRLGLKINFDYSLNYNYNQNKHLISFGNFTFWWFLIDLLKNLFIINPNDRLTASEAMNHPWFNLGIEDEGTI